MKTILTLLSLLSVFSLKGEQVDVQVLNLDGSPVEGANILTTFIAIRSLESPYFNKPTDVLGKASFQGKSIFGVHFYVTKPNYYDSSLGNVPLRECRPKTIYLASKLNPIPLYAKETKNLKIPLINQWVGFDFEKADWIAPHGQGKVEDFRVRLNRTFLGYPKTPFFELEKSLARHQKIALERKKTFSREEFDLTVGEYEVVLEVAFPSTDDGYFKENRFLSYSDLKMPHQAPLEGYLPDFTTKTTPADRGLYFTNSRTYGLFLRTRVVKDAEGRITSCHYAKMYGGFSFGQKGEIGFTYYFNPTANDRNLEFDLNRNLFGTSLHEPGGIRNP